MRQPTQPLRPRQVGERVSPPTNGERKHPPTTGAEMLVIIGGMVVLAVLLSYAK